jgi:hypothetical protein
VLSRVRRGVIILKIGAWRSLVARLVWDQEVGGSNPLAPTNVLMKPAAVPTNKHRRADSVAVIHTLPPVFVAFAFLTLTAASFVYADVSPPPPTLSTDKIANLVRSISARVEEIRGLRFQQTVQIRVASDAEANAHFKRRLHKFWPEERMRHDARVFAQLGLIPEGLDFPQLLFNVLEEQAGGYYDPESRSLVILDDMPSAIAPILLAHELTHALDDQHFHLDTLLRSAENDDDRATAVGAVVEGSATLMMSVFLMQEIAAKRIDPQALVSFQKSEAGKARRLKASPPLLQRTLLAPYILGQSFLLRGNMRGVVAGFPVDAVNQAFKKPPESTEQLLHPERYWDRYDAPGDISTPDISSMLGRGWRLVSSGRLGELILAIMTGIGGVDPGNPLTVLAGNWTHEPSIGWCVDRYQHYVRGDQAVTILTVLWDTPKDAREFADSLAPDSRRYIEQRDRAVVVIVGQPGFVAENLARRMFEAVGRPTAAVRPK